MSNPGESQPLRRSARDYASAWANLLPKGSAWQRDPISVLQTTIRGLAGIWGAADPGAPPTSTIPAVNVDGRAADLLGIESDPRQTIQLLTDWERAFGLPDLCLAEPLTISARHAALVARIAILGGQSRQWYIDYAASIGYAITITENAPYMCGISMVGNTVGLTTDNPTTPRWQLGPATIRFFWTVNVSATRITWFRVAPDGGQCGVDHMVEIAFATDLECALKRYSPGHATLLFNYTFDARFFPASAVLTLTDSPCIIGLNKIPPSASISLTGTIPTVTAVGALGGVPDPASLSLVGASPVLGQTPLAASLGLSGASPILMQSTQRVPSSAALSLSSTSPVAQLATNLIPSAATLTLIPSTPATISVPAPASLALAAPPPILLLSNMPVPASATLALTGTLPTATLANLVTPAPTSLSLTATIPAVRVANMPIPGSATLALTPAIPAIGLVPTSASLALAGTTPTIAQSNRDQPAAASLALTATTPTIVQSNLDQPAAATLALAATTPTIVQNNRDQPAAASLALAATTPTIAKGNLDQPAAASLALTATTPGVQSTANLTIVQNFVTTKGSAGATSVSATLPAAPKLGNLVIVGGVTGSNVVGVHLQDSNSHVYNLTPLSPFSNEVFIGWWVVTDASPSNVITASWASGTSTNPPSIWAIELTGNGASPFEVDATTQNASETVVNLPTLPTTNDGDFLFSVLRTDGMATSAGSPWTLASALPSPAYVSSAQNYLDGGATHASVATTLTATNVGDLIPVWVRWGGTTATMAVGDTLGNTYSSLPVVVDSLNGGSAQLFFCTNKGSGSNTITATPSAATLRLGIIAAEYSRVTTSIDQSASTAAGTPDTGAAPTTTNANDLVFGASSSSSGDVSGWTAGSGYTQRNTNVRMSIEDRFVSAIGSYDANWTATGGAAFISQLAAFKQASTPINAAEYYLQATHGSQAVAYNTTAGGNHCIVAAFKGGGSTAVPSPNLTPASGSLALSGTTPNVSTVASTSITITPVTGLVAPVAPGTVLYNCTVAPSNWTGTVTLSGTPADIVVGTVSTGAFTLVVGASPLGAGTYSGGTVTTNP